MALDDKDKLILIELQKDSDRTNKELASLVGLSPAAFSARKERLKQEGYIKGIHAVLSPEHFSLHSTGYVLVTFDEKGMKAEEDFKRVASSKPNVLDVHVLLGEYDAIVKLRAKNNNELLDIVYDIAAKAKVKTQTLVIARSPLQTTDISINGSNEPSEPATDDQAMAKKKKERS